MKKCILTLTALLLSVSLYPQTYKVTLHITGIVPDAGTIQVSIHDSEKSFSSHIPYKILEIPPAHQTADQTADFCIELPAGEYAFCIYQDINNDGRLNTNMIGIPKEPFGFSNYNGKSVPGNFNRHKVSIQASCVIPVPLVKI